MGNRLLCDNNNNKKEGRGSSPHPAVEHKTAFLTRIALTSMETKRATLSQGLKSGTESGVRSEPTTSTPAFGRREDTL